jgi:hypothetical protein
MSVMPSGVLHHGGIRTTEGGLAFSSALTAPVASVIAKAKAAAVGRGKKPPCCVTMLQALAKEDN